MSDQYLSGDFPTAKLSLCDQRKDADLKLALTAQFREAMPDADDAEIERLVTDCLARMQESK